MKTNYAVTRNGEILVESESLEYIQKMKREYEYRRTGRTTRMLFQALGNPAEEVVIIARNSPQARYLMDKVGEILKALDFPYVSNTAEGTIINFGKTYRFVTRDYMDSKYCKLHKSNIIKYWDED